jgi:hypothetical protein
MSVMHCSLLSLGCAFGFSSGNAQSTLTVLKALKIAQRRLRPEVRSKLLGVSSARSEGSLVPEAWRFVFLDPATRGNSRIVTVAAKTSSEHPETVEAFSSGRTEDFATGHPISQNKLLLDSDQILANARGAVKLKGFSAAEYHLTQSRNGQEPQWTLCFYAADNAKCVARLQLGAKLGAVKILAEELSLSRGA